MPATSSEEIAERRREVRRLLAGGRSHSEIAQTLGLPLTTVRNDLQAPVPDARQRPRRGISDQRCAELVQKLLVGEITVDKFSGASGDGVIEFDADGGVAAVDGSVVSARMAHRLAQAIRFNQAARSGALTVRRLTDADVAALERARQRRLYDGRENAP